jgi:hypothetical protein
MRCSVCSGALNLEQSYQIHIVQKPIACGICASIVSRESISVNAFIAKYYANKGLVLNLPPEQLALYPDTITGKYVTFATLEMWLRSEKQKKVDFPL